jgi:CTP:molybdopterin cytidylyltransferase MocA
LIEAYRTTNSIIVASEYSGVVGVPALYDHILFPQLIALSGDQGARGFLRTTTTPILLLPLPEAAVDLDTPEQYSSFLRSVR